MYFFVAFSQFFKNGSNSLKVILFKKIFRHFYDEIFRKMFQKIYSKKNDSGTYMTLEHNVIGFTSVPQIFLEKKVLNGKI